MRCSATPICSGRWRARKHRSIVKDTMARRVEDVSRMIRLADEADLPIIVYTPATERTHGYYVMPLLLGDRLVARIDLKTDSAKSALLAQSAHREPDVDECEVAAQLAEEMRTMADWLQLDRVLVSHQGDLSGALSRVVNARR